MRLPWVCVVLLFPVWLPILAFGVFLVGFDLGRPLFFRQTRIGYKGRPFVLFKLRTMREPIAGDGPADRERLSRTGFVLRSFSIDEIPELWNILRGDMSLVGPRPLLPEYMPLYSQREQLRHTVRPGLTGLAQIRGRNRLSWDARLESDVEYVENWSFLLDLKILTRTVQICLKRENIFESDTATCISLAEERRS